MEIIQALKIAIETTGNMYMRKKLEPVELRLAQGISFTEAIEEASLLPTAPLRMSASGEKTGRLGEMLSRAADYYEKETDSAVSTLTSLIEPVVIVVLGVLIAFILIAMYLPLFDLVGAV